VGKKQKSLSSLMEKDLYFIEIILGKKTTEIISENLVYFSAIKI
jgi:hypothetical protein